MSYREDNHFLILIVILSALAESDHPFAETVEGISSTGRGEPGGGFRFGDMQ
jgi:hypothetical protein